jgi:hypothetical protein
MFLYFFAPTLLPARTIPPGNGRMMPRMPRIASTAASAAASAFDSLSARISRLPPPIAFWTPNDSWTRNSPSMTGIRQ